MPKRTCIPAPDGYQYGVRYRDGSIAHGWNGRTQLDRAQEHIFVHAKIYGGARLTLVRRRIVTPAYWGAPFYTSWEHVDIDPWRKPITNYARYSLNGKRRYSWRGLTLARFLTAQAEAKRRNLHVRGVQQ